MRFKFNDKLRAWIITCVFSGNMVVLVNGSPNQEIKIQRGLMQGEPSAPFPFLLVVERLSGLFRRPKELSLFFCFRVRSSSLHIYHLQYVDDTLILANPLVENLWTIKVILGIPGLLLVLELVSIRAVLLELVSILRFSLSRFVI